MKQGKFIFPASLYLFLNASVSSEVVSNVVDCRTYSFSHFIAKLSLYRLFTILFSPYVAVVKSSSVPLSTVCRMLYCIVLLWSLNVCRGVNLVFRSCAPNDPAIRFVCIEFRVMFKVSLSEMILSARDREMITDECYTTRIV